MGSSDNRIAAARKNGERASRPTPVEAPRDTDEELPPVSGHHDTWPPSEDPTSRTLPPPPIDTIPTPPPSSGVVEHITIPSMPAVHIDD